MTHTDTDRSESADRLDLALDSPRLAPMLPLVYSAWLDGELDATELRSLEFELVALDQLEASDRAAICAWLDPEHPPSAEELAGLAAHIRQAARSPHVGDRPADTGLRLANDDQRISEVLDRADEAAGRFTVEANRRLLGTESSSIALSPLPDPGPLPDSFTALADLLDGSEGAVTSAVRRVLSRPVFDLPVDLDSTEYRQLVLEWTQELAHAGFGALGFPERLGGADDPRAFLAAFAEIARHDVSLLVKFGVQFGLFCGAVYRLGTERHHDAILPAALTMELPGCFAMTETGHGSNVAEIETTAVYLPDTDEIEIHTPHDLARKDYIGNAAIDGRIAVVFAQLSVAGLDHGVHAFLVPLRTDRGQILEGVRIEDDGPKAGLNGVDNGRIWFEHVRIPEDDMLDRFASIDEHGHYQSPITSPSRRFFTMLGTLVGGRVGVASAAVGSAETALAIAVRYATRRRQFGDTSGGEIRLIDYPSHQRRLMPRLARTYGYHLACRDLADDYVALMAVDGDGGAEHRALEARAAGIKAYATWHAVEVLGECREACGGQGYLSINRIAGLRADVDVFTTFEGDNTVLAQLVTKSLLTDYRTGFDDLGVLRIVQYLRSRVGAAVAESVPLVGAVSGPLDDPLTQSELLERRERHVIETLARRIRKRIDRGQDPAAAFVSFQPHVLVAARAYVERLIHDSFVAATPAAGDAAAPLAALRTLSALSMVEADLGWFLQHGLITPRMSAAIRSQVTTRAGVLAGDARFLVDAFRIPESVIAAPIAR